MWETLPNNADWDCFKTPILQEILRIQNLHQVEHCAFLKVIHLCQSVGSVRNKLQFRTVQQIRHHFLGRRIEVGRKTGTRCMGSDRRSSSRKHESEKSSTWKKSHGIMMIWTMLILFPQTCILPVRKLCCIFLKTSKQ